MRGRFAALLAALAFVSLPAVAAPRTSAAPAKAPATKIELDAPAAQPGLAAPMPSLEFDLLDVPAKTSLPAVDAATHAPDELLGKRRKLLTLHQTLGIALVAAMTGTMVTGQLNYSDRFGAAQSGRYELAHQLFSYTTLATFSATGLLALFAPVPPDRTLRFDRVLVHRIGMIGATAGMITQAVLGIVTSHSDGLARQQTLANAHLAVGYTTLGFMSIAVGSLVF